MNFLQLKVVIWKNFIIRKRHWLLSFIEAVLPILLFLLIAYGRSKVSGLSKTVITDVTYNDPQVIRYSDLDVSETRLFYAPNTEFYQDLMKRVQVKFQMYNNNIKGFLTSESLLQYYETHHNSTVIGIVFNGDQKSLDYVMRIHDQYDSDSINTAELYRNSFLFYPGQGTPYYYKGYISIQKAIDMSFIEKVSGKNLDNNVTVLIEEFPYPPHKEDSALGTLFMIYLPVITLFSFICLCPAVLKRVVEEKYTGTKELMKMVGMQPWMLWLGWFIHGVLPMLFSVSCIVLLMKIPFFGAESPPIEYTDGSLLFVFLMLYCMAATVFCFAISSLFTKPTIAMVAGILIWILSYFVPKYGLGLEEMGTKLSWSSNMLLNLLPNMALHYGYLTVSLYEERELGIQWNNFYKPSSGDADDITLLNVFVMLIIDIVFYMAFTLYMDDVNPGKYGIRKSFLFPIHSLIKLVKRPGTVEDGQGTERLHMDNVEEGRGMTIGIELIDLEKRFRSKVAVNKLNLNIYKNQITVLLGHNGAGKSTTMSMITGMIGATSGSIKMNGKDMADSMDEIRMALGLCPQHNLLFADLTVREHLIFFAKLKGRTAEEAEEEVTLLLRKLRLSEKKNAMACTLSGGMKRKLCLGMAVIGGSKILILDEPTSGMDPESCRDLWDLLLSWRGEKTILITTHFMEEADALGDWIAIMANGERQCHGTPMFLKKRYNTGYHLSLIVRDDATADEKIAISNSIKERLESAKLQDCNGNNMVFLMDLDDNSRIGSLLTFLEKEKDKLKILNISVTVTTLEDVFLKAKAMLEDEKDSDTKVNVEGGNWKGKHAAVSNQTELNVMRIKALAKKKNQFYCKKIVTYLIPISLAILFFVLTIYLSGNVAGRYGDNGPQLKLQLSAYKRTTAFYNSTTGNDLADRLKNAYKYLVEGDSGVAVDVQDVCQEIVNEGIENIVYYKEHVIASAEYVVKDDVQATAFYNPMATHSPPISLSLITNTLAKVFLGDDYSIKTTNWPLKTINSRPTREYSDDKVKLLWCTLMPIGFLLVVGSFMVFPHTELSTNFAQLQYMCGVKPYCYWLTTYVVDLVVYVPFSVVMAVIAVSLAPYIGTNEFFVLLLIFVVYGMANIPFAYLFSRKKSASAGFAVFVILGIFFGIILTLSVQVLLESRDAYYMKVGHILKIVFTLFLPQVGFAHSVLTFCDKAVGNYNMEVMSRPKRVSMCMENPHPCCGGDTAECAAYKSYLPLLQEDIGLMLITCVGYMFVNIALDSFRVKKACSKVKLWISKLIYEPTKPHPKDSILPSQNSRTGTLKVKNLCKTYSGKLIVNNIDFELNEKECLGILGVNGAGKTTTFRMLTREEIVDEGKVEIEDNTKRISIDEDGYLEKIGYCPQTDALNFVLTGRQILTVMGQLRGLDDEEVVNQFLQLFELQEYADVPCGYYSGGNKRKLSLAVALIGYPKYVLLDEPTNGVDPSSRKKFWNLIKTIKENRDLSFILTSHSMVECEALCNNLMIMKDGKFEKQGTISQLKEDQGGFNIKLKLINKGGAAERSSNVRNVDETSSSENGGEGFDEVDGMEKTQAPRFGCIEELKEYFKDNYKSTIKDEHLGLLHFYIEDKTRKWGSLFNEVEELKKSNPHLIEDYVVSEASLEDIFLTVARVRKVDDGKKKRKVKSGRVTV